MKTARKGNRWLLVAVLSACALPSEVGCRGAAKPYGSVRLTTSQDGSTSAVEKLRSVAGRAKAAAEFAVVCVGVTVIEVVKLGYTVLFKKDEPDPHSHLDSMWKSGYGFNNPNNERRREGKPLLNFDGTVAD